MLKRLIFASSRRGTQKARTSALLVATSALLLVAAMPAWANVQKHNSKSTAGVSTNPASAPAFTYTLVPGSVVTVGLYLHGSGTMPTPYDSAGNSYADCGPGIANTYGGSYPIEVFCAFNTFSSASNVISIANPSAYTFSIYVEEWTGLASGNCVDVYSLTNYAVAGSGSDNLTSGAAVTTADGDLIYGFESDTNGSGAASPGTGFTKLFGTYVPMDEYRIQSSAGSIAATWTAASGEHYGAVMIAFKAASAPSPSEDSGDATIM